VIVTIYSFKCNGTCTVIQALALTLFCACIDNAHKLRLFVISTMML
jgi:hypothetical protein